MKIEYKITSSITGGINETYSDINEFKERYNYICSHKKDFLKSRMIYFYKNTYNEEGKMKSSKTLAIIDLREER